MSITTTAPACAAPRHRTRWAYDHHGCRCPEAAAANAEHAARRRASLPAGEALDHEDVDLDRVNAVVRGERVALGRAERRLAVTRMFWNGVGNGEMAFRMGVTERTIQRIYLRLRDAGLVL